MARIRTVKPEFWTSGQVMRVSRDARLLFIGLLNFADDHGRGDSDPYALLARVFPGDRDMTPESVLRLLSELSTNALLVVYESSGRPLYEIPKFKDHQKIDKPSAPKYPPPGKNEIINVYNVWKLGFDEHSTSPPLVLATEGKGKGKGKGKEEETDMSTSDFALLPSEPKKQTELQRREEIATRVFEFWKSELNHKRTVFDSKRKSKILARIREIEEQNESCLPHEQDDPCELLCDVVRGAKLSPYHMGKNENGEIYDDVVTLFRDASQVDKFVNLLIDSRASSAKRANGIGVSIDRGEP